MKVDIVECCDACESSHSNDYLFVHELSHRINNELALIIGSASSTAARSTNDEVKKALAEVTRLLYHCADINRALAMPTHSTVIDASDYIRVLCQSIQRARLDDRGIDLVLIARPLRMRSERCWTLGIIVSELITNSVRHAFSDHGGKIQIELVVTGHYVRCCVVDNGSPQGSGVPGQGLKIMEALARDLDGEIVHRFGAEGAVSMLMFPLDGRTRKIAGNPRASDRDWRNLASAIYPS